MATSEFEKLERRYAENPQGLTFAPLAEVHRKNGDVARALELLRAGLELHPNYIPASIVLGRCHWDTGDLPAAEAAFSHVLRLDDENVIALKSLADINERLERFTEAQRWLNRLISVDRSNEEARQQLARLQQSKQPPGSPEVKPSGAAPADAPPAKTAPVSAAPASTAPLETPLKEAPAPEAPRESAAEIADPEPASKSAPLEFIDTTDPAPVAGSSAGDPVRAGAGSSPAPVDGLISQEFVPPKDTVFRSHPELTQDFVPGGNNPDGVEVEMAEEVELRSSGSSEFRVPNAAEEFMDLAASVLDGASDKPPPPSQRGSPRIEVPEPVPVAPAEPRAAAQPEKPQPAPIEPVAPLPPPEAKRPSYSAPDTKGQSVAAFFQIMLAARPAGPPGTPGDKSGGSQTSEVPSQQAREDPAEAAAGGTANSPPDLVSFDDFFGAATAGSNPAPQGSDPSKEDLDQFQSWLQNLKR
jgi:Tetratricopeptide repeat